MAWAPFMLAVIAGLLISALLCLVLVWPAREPPEPGEPGPGRAP